MREASGSMYPSPRPSTWATATIDTDGSGPDEGLFDATSIVSEDDCSVLGMARTPVTDDVRSNRSYITSGEHHIPVAEETDPNFFFRVKIWRQ